MAKPVFTWYPDAEGELDEKPNVNSTKFGDGYELRVPLGLNFMPQSWTLKFSRAHQEAFEILSFIRNMKGYLAFQWTNPLGEIGNYICREWKVQRTKGGNFMIISAKFEQVFEQ